MIRTIEIGRTFHVEAHEPHVLEQDLNYAVDTARQHAVQSGLHGILVTRHGYTNFTVAVSTEVPYGETHERHGPALSVWNPPATEQSSS
ncbi:hypothetical protein V3C33_05695 [Micrococcaceae bacterium Sec5.7]